MNSDLSTALAREYTRIYWQRIGAKQPSGWTNSPHAEAPVMSTESADTSSATET